MNDLLLIVAGIAVGTYFAEAIREKIPVLEPPAKDEQGATQ